MDFAEFFSEKLAQMPLSQAAFGRAVEMTGPFINMICRRKALPPLDRIDRWADVLQLTGAERDQFIRLAGVAHIPDPKVRARVVGQSYERRLEAFAARVAERQGLTNWEALAKIGKRWPRLIQWKPPTPSEPPHPAAPSSAPPPTEREQLAAAQADLVAAQQPTPGTGALDVLMGLFSQLTRKLDLMSDELHAVRSEVHEVKGDVDQVRRSVDPARKQSETNLTASDLHRAQSTLAQLTKPKSRR